MEAEISGGHVGRVDLDKRGSVDELVVSNLAAVQIEQQPQSHLLDAGVHRAGGGDEIDSTERNPLELVGVIVLAIGKGVVRISLGVGDR